MISKASSWNSGRRPSPDAVVERLRQAARAHDVLRIKGFLAVRDRPLRSVVQGVGNNFRYHFDRPFAPGEPRVGRLVIIGRAGLDQAAIAAAIRG